MKATEMKKTAGRLYSLILWAREGQVPGFLKQIGKYTGG